MIKLYQFEPAFGIPNASPFCMKVENYLRMAGMPYEVSRNASVLKAPKGKLPYIEDDGKRIADSAFIIEYLKATYGDKLDSGLTPEQRAIVLAFQRLLEENSYWALVHTRWGAPEGWPTIRKAFFGKVPPPLKWFVPTLARRGLLKQLRGHGMGRHDQNEIHAIGKRDITALADFLDGKPYFMGDQPCSLDASAYAFIANLLWVPVDSALQRHARQYPQLDAYCQRMKARYYS